MKIIFFLCNNFSKRDYLRFGVDELLKHNYEIEFWNLTPWINLKYFLKYEKSIFKSEILFKNFFNIYEIKESLSKLDQNTVIIDSFSIVENYKSISQIIQKNTIIIGTFKLGLFPFKSYSIINKLIITLQNFTIYPFSTIKIIFMFIIKNIFFKKKHIKYNFAIIGGKKARTRFNFDDYTTIVNAHSFDYDSYLESKNISNDLKINDNKSYSVFLDENVPFHPDYLYLSLKPYCKPKIYYSEINNFFQYYENKTGFKIIIAAHPRSNYFDQNPFDNRMFFYNQTVNLVKNSKHVFLHMSTSINFPILYSKPITFVDSTNYSSLLRHNIKTISDSINVLPIDISKPYKKYYYNDIINAEKYKEYTELYIKESNTEEKSISNFFVKYLSEISN